MIRVIINADDFGLNPIVNTQIENFIMERAISSTTVLANTDYIEEVCRVANDYNYVSFGVHLNLTQGRSLSNSPILRKYNLLSNDNCFIPGIHKIVDYPDELIQAIEFEWENQIEKLLSAGINLSHIDGHHHIHGLSPLTDSLINVAHKFEIDKVRARYRIPVYWKIMGRLRTKQQPLQIVEKRTESTICPQSGHTYNYSVKERINAVLAECRWRRRIAKASLATTDYFGQYSSIYNLMDRGERFLKNSTIELMCHPGHPNYSEESAAIYKKRLRDIQNYSLVSYNEL